MWLTGIWLRDARGADWNLRDFVSNETVAMFAARELRLILVR